MFVPQATSFVVRWRYVWLYIAACLLVSSFFLAACSSSSPSFGGGVTSHPTAKSTPSQVPLAQLHWCNKPFILFRDQHAPVTGTSSAGTAGTTATAVSTPGATATVSGSGTAGTTATPDSPSTVTNWSQIKPNLGFTVFLPTTLPGGSCLVSASGTLHDPIFGGNFIIGYLLPDSNPISLSEAPQRSNSQDFQCTSSKGQTGSGYSDATMRAPASSTASTPTLTASPTQVPILLCTGVKDSTSIVFSGRGTETSLKQFFDALQSDVAWVPVS
ncbi:MAG: hypothetical protein NVS4B7_09360 [Ktedonobacteraceae bacterium]